MTTVLVNLHEPRDGERKSVSIVFTLPQEDMTIHISEAETRDSDRSKL